MIEIKITAEDRARVSTAERIFSETSAEFERMKKLGGRLVNVQPDVSLSNVPTRAMQLIQTIERTEYEDLIPCIVLGIVEESNTMLPVAIGSDDQTGIESALGHMLIDACLLCSHLQFDFLTIAREFSSASLKEPEGDALIALYKAVGILASVAINATLPTAQEDEKIQFGYVITMFCSAVHWLAFNNDLDVVTLMHRAFFDASSL